MSTFTRYLDTLDDRRKDEIVRDIARRFVWGEFTWDPPSLTANTTTDTTLTTSDVSWFTGLRAGMVVYVSPPAALNAGVVVGGALCPDDGQLTIRLGNLTGASINPASGTWVLFAFQP